MAERHTELQIVKKNSGRQAKGGAIGEKPVADLSNELQMVKNSCRQHNKLQIVIKQWQTAKRN